MSGDFHNQDAVKICDAEGVEIARGLVNFPAEDLIKIKVIQGQAKLTRARTSGQSCPPWAGTVGPIPTYCKPCVGPILVRPMRAPPLLTSHPSP